MVSMSRGRGGAALTSRADAGAGTDAERGSRLSQRQLEAYRRIPDQVDCVFHPRFDEPDIQDRLFGPGTDIHVPKWVCYASLSDEAAAPAVARTALSGKDETALFLRYNYARYRLSRLLAAQRRRYGDTRAAQMVQWFERAQQARSDLAEANMALVPAMARRWQIPAVEFAELVSEGNMALLRTIDKFDVSRGFKFSTYACRAILAAFQRLSVDASRYRRRFTVEHNPEWETDCSFQPDAHSRDSNALHALQRVLDDNLAQLTEMEKRILLERFPITGQATKRTLREISDRVGMSNERVRQLQNAALSKVRTALEAVL